MDLKNVFLTHNENKEGGLFIFLFASVTFYKFFITLLLKSGCYEMCDSVIIIYLLKNVFPEGISIMKTSICNISGKKE